jgi:hypothetical protein
MSAVTGSRSLKAVAPVHVPEPPQLTDPLPDNERGSGGLLGRLVAVRVAVRRTGPCRKAPELGWRIPAPFIPQPRSTLLP